MAFDFIFNRKSGGSAENTKGTGKGGSTNEDGFKPDARKAAAFFKHAESTAASRSYDYAIECYINGLEFDPDNVKRHEELREVAKRRKVNGGKPASLKEKISQRGKQPIQKMLHQEQLWSKDPLNMDLALKVMQHATEAQATATELDLSEVSYWIGSIIMEQNQTTNKPNHKAFVQLCDLYAQIPAFNKAVEACRMALMMEPQDEVMLSRLKDLEAEQSMQEGSYGADGDFRKNIKDVEQQKALADDDEIVKTDEVVESTIDRRRREFDEAPDDATRMIRLVDALLAKEESALENEAIEVLDNAWKKTDQYAYKVRIGDIRMKQMRRTLREARARCKTNPADISAKEEFQKLNAEAAQLQLAEFTERAKNYPTDMNYRFELGRRLFSVEKYDEAIAEFQKAQADPKHRPASLHYLGRCYTKRGWFDEAIDTLREGEKAVAANDAKLSMRILYALMDALERAADESQSLELAIDAQKTASKILQTDINYLDIRDRMDRIKTLVTKLRSG